MNFVILNSKLKNDNENEEKKQQMHYLSIPLRANYDLYKKGDFNLYGSLGVSASVGVYGKVGDTSMRDDKVRFASQVALGAQYRLFGNLGIFLEPALDYHFKSNSDIIVIYDDQKTNFNLSAGFRLIY